MQNAFLVEQGSLVLVLVPVGPAAAEFWYIKNNVARNLSL